MSRLGRKPLDAYTKLTDADLNGHNLPASGRVLRSTTTTTTSRQRSVSPKKTNLYPDIEADAKSARYHELYPELDVDDSLASQEESELNFSDNTTLNGTTVDTPVAPPRRRPNARTAEHERDRQRLLDGTDEESAPHRKWRKSADADNNWMQLLVPLLALLATGTALAWHLGYLDVMIDQVRRYRQPDTTVEEFEERFKNFTHDYKKEFHTDSIRTLHSALVHHVEMKADNARAENYPTCVLLAGDEKSLQMQNHLTDTIAALIPHRVDDKRDKIRVVDLADKSTHTHKADEEDLRSRVHHSINLSLKEGANIFVFRNLEALAREDLPLLELFYSYCDGANPTFPKTLWILTMTTKDLQILNSPEKVTAKEFHRNAGRAIERYLANFLENKPQGGFEERTAANPLLTRIANYIIPIIHTGRAVPKVKSPM